MLAIPVLRSRVAPVLNWCSTVLIIPGDEADAFPKGQEMRFEGIDPFELIRVLKSVSVSTLICGALTSELLAYGKQLGLEIIYGIAGELDDVFSAYRSGQLDDISFRLPGCDGAYRRRRG